VKFSSETTASGRFSGTTPSSMSRSGTIEVIGGWYPFQSRKFMYPHSASRRKFRNSWARRGLSATVGIVIVSFPISPFWSGGYQ
jgi:hypothetical protein